MLKEEVKILLRLLPKHFRPPGDNFTNIACTSFTSADPKSAKKTDDETISRITSIEP